MRALRHRWLATLALTAFVATLGLPLVAAGHGLGDDVDFGWGGRRLDTDHPVTQVESVNPATADDHCPVCHWGRAVGTSVLAEGVRHDPPSGLGSVGLPSFRSVSTITLIAAPPRGPPSIL